MTLFQNSHWTAALLAALVSTGSLLAQPRTGVIPKKYRTTPGRSMSQTPFALQPNRFQQIWTAKELQAVIKKPVRIRGIKFRTKSSGNAGKTVDVQIVMGHHKGNVTTRFADNLKGAQLVFQRKTVTLPRSVAGGFVVSFPFTQEFTWDHERDIVMEVRVFKNGNANRPFLYWFDWITSDFSVGMTSMWAISPSASRATFIQGGTGLVSEFEFVEGVTLPFGTGCKGEGGFTPEISTNGLPLVGNTALRVNITKAKPGVAAILFWGFSDKQFGAFKLPLDLRPIGMPGCSLFVDPLLNFFTSTVGGSPGAGVGSVPFGIPAVTQFQGIVLYAQWAINDGTNKLRPLPFAWSNAAALYIG